MKKLLILAAALVLVGSAGGCNCLRCMFRGEPAPAYGPAPAYSAPCAPACNPCDPCGAPAAVMPGPESYGAPAS